MVIVVVVPVVWHKAIVLSVAVELIGWNGDVQYAIQNIVQSSIFLALMDDGGSLLKENDLELILDVKQ